MVRLFLLASRRPHTSITDLRQAGRVQVRAGKEGERGGLK